MTRRLAPRRGFTLVELMIGLATSTIILAGIATAFIAIQRSYQAEAQLKAAVEGSRVALSYLERQVRLAGYGLDPRFAFDFSAPGSLAKDNAAGTGFTSDDLAFRYRDPTFLRRGTVSSGNLTLTASTGSNVFGFAVKANQGFVVVCDGGVRWRVFRVSSATDLTSQSQVSVSADANLGQGSTTEGCFSDTTNPAYVMLLREVRIRVISLGTPARPYLVRFNSFADPTTSTDYDPIAADIENFQVAYLLNRPRPGSVCCAATTAPDAGNRNWIAGDNGSELPAAGGPTMDVDYDNAARYQNSAGNIRGVRMTLVARSTSRDPTGKRSIQVPAVENFTPTSTAADGYFRSTATTAVRTPNLLSRAFFVPPLQPAGQDPTVGCVSTESGVTCDGLNRWGG